MTVNMKDGLPYMEMPADKIMSLDARRFRLHDGKAWRGISSAYQLGQVCHFLLSNGRWLAATEPVPVSIFDPEKDRNRNWGE